jgi:hypothetical protein
MKYEDITEAQWRAMEREATTQDARGFERVKDFDLFVVIKKRCGVDDRGAWYLIDQRARHCMSEGSYRMWRGMTMAWRIAASNGYR